MATLSTIRLQYQLMRWQFNLIIVSMNIGIHINNDVQIIIKISIESTFGCKYYRSLLCFEQRS